MTSFYFIERFFVCALCYKSVLLKWRNYILAIFSKLSYIGSMTAEKKLSELLHQLLFLFLHIGLFLYTNGKKPVPARTPWLAIIITLVVSAIDAGILVWNYGFRSTYYQCNNNSDNQMPGISVPCIQLFLTPKLISEPAISRMTCRPKKSYSNPSADSNGLIEKADSRLVCTNSTNVYQPSCPFCP